MQAPTINANAMMLPCPRQAQKTSQKLDLMPCKPINKRAQQSTPIGEAIDKKKPLERGLIFIHLMLLIVLQAFE